MTTIRVRRGTAAQWTSVNPVLAGGEIGFEQDTGKHKIGDGVTAWAGLDYFVDWSDLESTYAPANPGTSDGQILEWDVASGRYLAAAPVGNSELAVAENVTGAATALSTAGGAGTIVTIPFTSIVVGDSGGRPVTLEYFAGFKQTTAGLGTVFLLLYETTGAETLVGQGNVAMTGFTTIARQQAAIPLRQKRIGAVTTDRSFLLKAYIYSEAGDDAAGDIMNAVNQPTILRAVAG